MNDHICPVCKRPIPEGTYNEHHLMPATFRGKEKIRLHKICHEKLHHSLSEKEMQHYYHTIERLLEHEEIQKFVKWVKKQPPEFITKHKDTKARKRQRKR